MLAKESYNAQMIRESIEAGRGHPFAYSPPPPPAANDNGLARHPRIIGLMGYGGAGKSTAAEVLVDQFGFRRTKFAGPLKSMMRALYNSAGMPRLEIERRIEGDLKEVPDDLLQGRTPRQAMQWLGTEWGRGFFGDNLWVDLWAAGLDATERYVVDDCRFPNEAAAIRARGGIVVLVDRPGFGPVNGHSSETPPTDPDVVLHNGGTIHYLRSRVAEIV